MPRRNRTKRRKPKKSNKTIYNNTGKGRKQPYNPPQEEEYGF